jgi:cytoskeletal protein RodZ
VATKSRQRGKGGAAPGAPKPKVEPRKQPLLRRTWFRRTFVVVLALVLLWVGLFTWGRVSRASALRSYEKKLFDAARPFFQDIEQGTASIQQTVADFSDGKIKAAALGTAAAKWEADFTTAHAAVSKLNPPSELKDAQATFVSALEEYVGAARFYIVVQKQQELKDAIPAKSTKLSKQASDQVQLLLQHVSAMRARGDALYTHAVTAINGLAKSWGVETKTPFPAPPGAVAPAGLQGLPSGLTPVTPSQ